MLANARIPRERVEPEYQESVNGFSASSPAWRGSPIPDEELPPWLRNQRGQQGSGSADPRRPAGYRDQRDETEQGGYYARRPASRGSATGDWAGEPNYPTSLDEVEYDDYSTSDGQFPIDRQPTRRRGWRRLFGRD